MLTWGLIGAGEIAYVFANAMRFSKTGRVGALASHSAERGQRMARDLNIPKVYDTYEALLADDTIAAVYIATLNPAHLEWALKSAAAGKHIVVEKPMGMNAAQVQAMIEAARAYDVFLMEGFMYRCHPQTRRTVELIREGAIGQVRVIRATFAFHGNGDLNARWYANELGGGGILDVGCYPASMVRLLAGAASDKPFLDPTEFRAVGVLGSTGVDHYTAAVAKFENNVVAEMVCGIEVDIPRGVSVFGSEGMLSIAEPWVPCSPCRTPFLYVPLDTQFPSGRILLERRGEEAKEIDVPTDRDLYTYEADTVAENLDKRQAPAMSWDDSLGNARMLDRWLEAIGVRYK
jgi:predicted dehydrogenase